MAAVAIRRLKFFYIKRFQPSVSEQKIGWLDMDKYFLVISRARRGSFEDREIRIEKRSRIEHRRCLVTGNIVDPSFPSYRTVEPSY